MRILFCLLVLLSLCFHGTLRAQSGTNGPHPTEQTLAIVALQISHTGNDLNCSLISYTTVQTKIDRIQPASTDWSSGDLVCHLLDTDDQLLETIVVKQPLTQRYEYPNEDGTIGSTSVQLTQKTVILRFAFQSRMKYFDVNIVDESRQLKKQTRISIPETQK